jgi:hypothetical protein
MVYPVAATVQTYTPGSSISYKSPGSNFAEAVSASLSWERADGHFYGDDVELDSDNGVLGYTIDFEPTGLNDAARALLLGETVSTGEYTITDAAAPDVGFGYVRVMRDQGTVSYEAWWFYKLKFGVSSEETRTKERSIEWRTPTLQGVGAGVSLDSTGTLSFCLHKTFTSLSDAKSWLNSKAGIT